MRASVDGARPALSSMPSIKGGAVAAAAAAPVFSKPAVATHLALHPSAVRDEEEAGMWLRKCYRAISRLSVLNEQLGLRGGYSRGGERSNSALVLCCLLQAPL